jgi:hypothetical protein
MKLTSGTWYVDGLSENQTQLWIRTIDRPIASILIGKEAETDKANACLIAGAPTLLAACRMVVERWEQGDLAEAARACSVAIAEAVPADPIAKEWFAIHSADEGGYWSNDEGWSSAAEATVFTAAERVAFYLPIGGAWVTLKPYSVLLLYPDYATDGRTETHYAWVEAHDPSAAVAEAQRHALAANAWSDTDPADFIPLLVIGGHHYGQPVFSE